MLRVVWLCVVVTSLTVSASVAAKGPNVIVILTDDIGYGDLSCFGAKAVKTPNLDKFAAGGMTFTDAHSPAAVCTPTRYSLMTGQYSFRHRPGASILPGNAPLSIPIDLFTLPKLFQQAGYATGVVGKWHLGLGETETNYNVEIKPGPKEVGFDYSFLIPATGDRVPCVFVENARVVGYDPKDPIQVSFKNKIGNESTGKEHPELLTNQKPSHGHDNTIVNGISRIGYMTGGKAARWKDEDIADTITGKAVKFITDNKAKPFFLYFATHDVHVPRVPHPRFKGTSGHGLRGDVIQECDWCVGEIVKTLAENKLTDDTLIIFTSDNGGVRDDGYQDGIQTDKSGHSVNGVLKGFKGGLLEGGHRIPMIASWPGHVPAGATSTELMCHVDMLATFAAMLEQKLPAGANPDGVNVLPAYLAAKPEKPCRTELIHQAGNLSYLALRQGNYKYIPPPPMNMKAEPQLYDVVEDISETKNLAKDKPEMVKAMAARLAELRK
ncbi:sulfatase-like hydrolase/transferase [soil metagenome]